MRNYIPLIILGQEGFQVIAAAVWLASSHSAIANLPSAIAPKERQP
jgi:hypothetical protein